MSKKRFGGFVLASALVLSAVTVVGLTSCGSTEKAETITAIAISNKSTLQAAWKVGEASRSIEATITGSQKNFSQLVSEGTVTITSSDASVVKVEGVTLTPLKDGKVTITVASGELKDTVEITVAKAQEKVTSVTVTNKDALTAEFRIGDDDRTISIKTNPVVNVNTAINEGRIKITSSSDAVTVQGNKIHASKVGKATITVKCDDVQDTFDVEIKERIIKESITYKNAIKDAGTVINSSKGTSEKEYNFRGVVVANDLSGNTVIFDGESYFPLHSPKNADKFDVGDLVYAEGKLNNYYGVIQVEKPELITAEGTEAIEIPTPEKFESKQFSSFIKEAKENNNKLKTSGVPTQIRYIETSVIWDGSHKKTTEFYFDDDSLEYNRINIEKSKEAIKNKLNNVTIGSTVTIKGALIGLNTGFGYHNLILEEYNVTKEAVPATSIQISADKTTLKLRENTNLNVNLTPVDAGGKITYTLDGDKDAIEISDGKIYAMKAGTVKIKASISGLATPSNELTITINEEENDDLIKTAEKVTVDQLAAKTMDNKKLYKVTGVVVDAKDSDYGNLTIADKTTGNKLDNYGTAANYRCWTLPTADSEDQKVKFTNPKEFKTKVINKLFAVGDEVEFIAMKYENDKGYTNNYYFSFNRLVTKKADLKYSVKIEQADTLVTANKTSDLTLGEQVILTPDTSKIPEGKQLMVTVNEKELSLTSDGKYTFNAEIINKVRVEIGDKVDTFAFNSKDLGLDKYADSSEPKVLKNGLKVSFTQLGDYGSGIQSKNKEGKVSSLWIESAIDKEIASITITASKDCTSAKIGFAFGAEKVTTVDENTTKTATGLKANSSVTINSDVTGAKYFCFKHLSGGVAYIESIKINFKVAA